MSDHEGPAECQVSPLPSLRWEWHSWQGEYVFPAWAGFQSSRGSYGGRDSLGASDGRVRIRVSSPSPATLPSAEQLAAFSLLVEQQAAIRDAMLDALLPHYKKWRKKWSSAMDAEDFERLMPPVSSPSLFQQLVGLSCVHIIRTNRKGVAYTGFECGCTWDDEHGLGFMTHGQHIVEVGGADTSFLEWIAENDKEQRTG